MSCECYQVGGRFIAEDPDCPRHGTAAQRDQQIAEEQRDEMEERVYDLEQKVADLVKIVRVLVQKAGV